MTPGARQSDAQEEAKRQEGVSERIRPLLATLKLDVKLQARSKLYGVGIAVAVILGVLGRFLIGPDYAAKGVPILYLLGLGGTTYIFGASLILMEKSQGTLQALRVTPLTTGQYLSSKLITLILFAAVEGAIVQVIGFWGVSFNPLPLAAGVLTLGLMNTLVGLGQVASHDSVLKFLMPGAALIGSAMQWPFLGVLEIGPEWLWYAIPTNGPLLMMLAAFEPLDLWQWVYAIVMTTASIALAAWWARRRFRTHIRLRRS